MANAPQSDPDCQKAIDERLADLGDPATLSDPREHAPWNTLVQLLRSAAEQHCDEIHIEPERHCLRVRFLRLGCFQEIQIDTAYELNSTLEWLQQRLPSLQTVQTFSRDWFVFKIGSNQSVYQVELVLTAYGKHCVIRKLHDYKKRIPELDELIINPAQYRQLKNILNAGSGLMLFAGLEPNHLMTTLRSAAQSLASPERRIVIAETDMPPRMARTTQIIMGNPPDTAQLQSFHMACQQSADVIVANDTCLQPVKLMPLATGKSLVLQGVIADRHSSAVAQVIASGVRPEVIAETLLGIAIQHRVARLCLACRIPQQLNNAEISWLNAHQPIRENDISAWLNDRMEDRFSSAQGCDLCNGTGIAQIMTVLDITEPDVTVRDAMYNNDVPSTIMLLRHTDPDAQRFVKLAQSGIIPLSEAMRVTQI
ncbi:MAG: hypothetical protein KTR32_18085 [Granulosicoccus sp.]|nr:hypothetical protein [Granulosicoccus sp.]